MIRVCPNPDPWYNVFKKLSKFADEHENLSKPPIPLILNGWVYSNDWDKKERWEQTVAWARNAGCSELTDSLSDEDFYFTSKVTTYAIGPLGGPMYREWDYETKDRPSKEALEQGLLRLQSEWSTIARELADATQPIGFTGAKARRLVIGVLKDVKPPWGDWDRLSGTEEKRRTFTVLRQTVNKVLEPLGVDHIDFKIQVKIGQD
jgi:hypothetical protein